MCSLSNFRVGRCNIQSAFILLANSMLDDVERYESMPDVSHSDIKMDDDVKTLIDAGFTSNEKVIRYYDWLKAEKEKNESYCELKGILKKSYYNIEVLLASRDTFGKDTLYIPLDDFRRIVDEYGAECCGISEYKGNISDRKLAEASRLKSVAKQIMGDEHKLFPVSKVIRTFKYSGEEEYLELKDKLKGFPFIKKKTGYSLFTLTFIDNSTITPFHNEVTLGEPTQLFILSPKCTFKKIEPIFCAFIGVGVLVFLPYAELGGRRTFKRLSDFNRRLSMLGF